MKKASIIALCLTINASFAAQIKTIMNYDEVSVNASITEPNTLLLRDDRIAQMQAPANTLIDVCNGKPNCKLIDQTTGALTFMPSPLFHTRAFSLNLTTEQGNFYTIRVTPKPISSQTILLKTYQKPVIPKVPQLSFYEQSLLIFLRHLVNERIPEGFTQVTSSKPKLYKGRFTHLRLLTTLTGNQWQGEVFELTNTSQRPIDVKESWLNWSKTKAIAVVSHHLLPRQSTLVYRISTHVH
ncbi:type-F conjugative transfer system secretin TraK [Legionella longbeachae]|uniref:type-F conjugative transfer system secretin TraK n=1 Tax=Legionella longbeachae TaxID=450 RepID=UPI0009B789EF|nr:type-F conjugative transfer system secretin TraK [Legionella longbeachae]VEE02708.1 putative conjugative transfer protein TraK [Legionella oakridgensis]ARB91029.1 type-F conjugative transfer system secretin TraK [Legionella longbeachae]ARM32544.1 type-F conjugative transfer system secretin TraK [Legionella longbeachae]RZV21180.1 type-F conjugative transfer system secretin TraK [Legionella longbeachae]UAK45771.1 type-F conjugative transfer system secretin TraK [Legionella longbeachae]